MSSGVLGKSLNLELPVGLNIGTGDVLRVIVFGKYKALNDFNSSICSGGISTLFI